MESTIVLDGISFEVEIIRKKSIKNIYLRLVEFCKIQIRTNPWVEDKYIFDFIRKKSLWILKNNKSKEQSKLKQNELLYLGRIYQKEELLKENVSLEQFYKSEAIKFITPIVEKYSDFMSLYPKALKFRNNKSRWGSCSFENNINLNINLIKHNPKFIEYVVVHELAHIKHKNHKKEFWSLVKKYLPDFKQRQKLCELVDKS